MRCLLLGTLLLCGCGIWDNFTPIEGSTTSDAGNDVVQQIEFEFEYEIAAQFSAPEIEATLQNVPVPIDLSEEIVALSLAAGDDIIATERGNVLASEFERSRVGGVLWVKLPEVRSGATIDLVLYVGNENVERSETDRDVWSNGYEAVWHLDQLSSVGRQFESSVLGHELNAGNGFAELDIEGTFGPAVRFDFSSDQQLAAPTVSVTPGSTVLFFLKSDWRLANGIAPPTTPPIFGPWAPQGENTVVLAADSDAQNSVEFFVRDGTGIGTSRTVSSVEPDRWTLFQFGLTQEGQSFFWVDGEEFTTGPVTLFTGASPVVFGAHPAGWFGDVDEIRVSNVERSSPWIAFQHSVLARQARFTVGTPEKQ